MVSASTNTPGKKKIAWAAKDEDDNSENEASNRPPYSLVMAAGSSDDEDHSSEHASDLGDEQQQESKRREIPAEFRSREHVDWDAAPGITGWIAKAVRNHYYIVFAVFLLLVHVTLGIVFLLPPDENCVENGGRGQMQVCTQSEHDWELSFRNASKRKDAIAFARAEGSAEFAALSAEYLSGDGEGGEEPRMSVSETMNLRLLFWFEDEEANRDSSIFTPKKVKAMCELEAAVTAHPFYPHFCYLDDSLECAPQPFSVAARFYPPDALDPFTGGCRELTEDEVSAASAALAADFESTASFFAATDAGNFTNRTRSLLQLGAPLEGYSSADDRANEQRELFLAMFADTACGGWPEDCAEDYKCAAVRGYCNASGIEDGERVKGVETVLFERYALRGYPSSGAYEGAFVSPYDDAAPVEEYEEEEAMAVRFWSGALQQEEFGRAVNGDLNFAVISVLVVFLYIWFHTQSLFVASLCMFQIVVSLPVGFFFYYNVIGIHYYASVNILAIYLALGIGADSVFVMSDCWNQSRSNPEIRTILGRLSYSVHRTVSSCFNTTLTTVMSFVATSFTPVVPIYCFAAFAAVVLAVNYLFVCLVTPTIIMIHHVHFSDVGGSCCYCSKTATGYCAPKEPYVDEDLAEIRASDSLYQRLPYAKWQAAPTVRYAHRAEASEVRGFEEEEDVEEGGEKGDGATGGDAGAEELSKLSMSERFFHSQFFAVLDARLYGVKVVAALAVLLCVGYAIFMATQAFRLTPPSSQEEWFPSSHMFSAELTDRLFDNWKGSSDSGYMSLAFVFGIEGVDRSPHNRLFPNHDRGFNVYDADFDLSSKAAQLFFLRVCAEVEAAPCDAAACEPLRTLALRGEVTCVLRDLLAFYHNVSSSAAAVIPPAEFDQLALDFFTNTAYAPAATLEARIAQFQSVIGFDGAEPPRVQWAAITFRSTATLPLSNADSGELFDEVEGVVEALAAEAPPGMASMFQTDTQASGFGWTWRDVENALIQNLITGFAICFPVAFVVLILATGNFFIALYATASIAFIVAGVLGAAKLYYGWDLGIAESIAGVIVIGFSVDYTVHLGHMYRDGEGSREDKTLHALTYMGATVIGGGLTTLCSGLVLFLCTLTFFTKMALLLVWTVALSIVYALFFFMPMCLLFGPQGSFGEIPSIASCMHAAQASASKQVSPA